MVNDIKLFFFFFQLHCLRADSDVGRSDAVVFEMALMHLCLQLFVLLWPFRAIEV